MIEGNVFKFGYGDICVGADSTGQISFQQFKPPACCGEYLYGKDIEFIGEKIIIKLSFEESNILYKYLKEVECQKITQFTFKDYIFDFTNYNKESIAVCKRKVQEAVRLLIMCIAA